MEYWEGEEELCESRVLRAAL
jgi:hypothetical protein